MGLRYRKSIQICKGVRLNFSKTGVSISAGVPGYRKNYNLTTGRQTTTYSIPGTGISYVDTKTRGKSTEAQNNSGSVLGKTLAALGLGSAPSQTAATTQSSSVPRTASSRMAERETARKSLPAETGVPTLADENSNWVTIHFASDTTINWSEIAASSVPPADELERYLQANANAVLSGDLDTYLQIISDLNPFDDLMDYGMEFECGTDDAQRMDVEYAVRQETVFAASESLPMKQYQLLFQDFVCSCAIRVARDVFALLPVKETVVNVTDGRDVILSVRFPKKRLSALELENSDASDVVCRFENNMEFSPERGFRPVLRLED